MFFCNFPSIFTSQTVPKLPQIFQDQNYTNLSSNSLISTNKQQFIFIQELLAIRRSIPMRFVSMTIIIEFLTIASKNSIYLAIMQANYPNKMPTVHWDTLNTNYPVNKYHETGISSETIAREARGIPETLRQLQKKQLQDEINYSRNYNLTRGLTKSQYTVDYVPKQGERKRFNKNNSCANNLYIYPPDSKLLHNPPDLAVFGVSETKNAFVKPTLPSRVVSDKNQFKHPACLPLDPPPIEPFHKHIEPLDTTYEGFEKHLDPYLTTSRLYHRPYSAEYLNRISNSKDVITYYTCSEQPWVRSLKPNLDRWRLPLSRPKSIFDREKFKEDFREIRTHNKPQWTPGSFRTEARENYKRHESKIHNQEEDVQNYFQLAIAHLQTTY